MNATSDSSETLTSAHASFTIDSWDSDDLLEAGGQAFSRATVTKTFTGDIEGTSVAWLVLSMVGTEGAEYVGLETFDVTVHGRAGRFVLLHQAANAPDLVRWTIAPGSGTEQLEGLAGSMTIAVADDGSHTCILEPTLDPAVT